MYIKNCEHNCTQLHTFFYSIDNLSVIFLYIVCKIKNLCAKREFCVQKLALCANCVQSCADCVRPICFVCFLYLSVFQTLAKLCAVVCICVHCFSRACARPRIHWE